MIIDSHVHLFNRKIIENVSGKTDMVQRLGLCVEGAQERCEVGTLKQQMRRAGVDACLLLPTAAAKRVQKTNDLYWQYSQNTDGLFTAGTLHPAYPHNLEEIQRFKERGIKGIKLCSFSQGFALHEPAALELFDLIRRENVRRENTFFVVLDTFYEAPRYFGALPRHITTPRRLGHLIEQFPEIPFIAAHMGGQSAPFEEICKYLPAAPNLSLDTSNGLQTLSKQEFIHLLEIHGPEHILFGTDWPWFDPAAELPLVNAYLEEAGFSSKEKEAVCGGNIARLLGKKGKERYE
ncbi:MAG: amidohydrolase family protein [Candidatus Aminicenantes bacterium]|nr:amidohydrolase family protein [Candidatus Aminicenantes bacterium]